MFAMSRISGAGGNHRNHIDTADDYEQDITACLRELQQEETRQIIKQTQEAAESQERQQLSVELEQAQQKTKDEKQQRETLREVLTLVFVFDRVN